MGDTLSIKVYQALASALDLNPKRRVVLSDSGNFPSDLYMAQGLLSSLGRGHELKIVEPEEVEDAIDDSVAVLMLTEVDYRTGRLHDMKALTRKAHAAGALAVWDLAHSAGALPGRRRPAPDADFAVGCTYKYLNGGPGAPAFIYVAPKHAETARPALSGWMGHEAPFAFDLDYRAGARHRAHAGRHAAGHRADRARRRARRLGRRLDGRCPRGLDRADRPVHPRGRGALPRADARLAARRRACAAARCRSATEQGYAIMQALIARGVIGDFRAPDAIRFGFTPLYIGEADVLGAVDILEEIMANRLLGPAANTAGRRS